MHRPADARIARTWSEVRSLRVEIHISSLKSVMCVSERVDVNRPGKRNR
jgi:hypothetical protein